MSFHFSVTALLLRFKRFNDLSVMAAMKMKIIDFFSHQGIINLQLRPTHTQKIRKLKLAMA